MLLSFRIEVQSNIRQYFTLCLLQYSFGRVSHNSSVESNKFRRNMLLPSSERCGKRGSSCVRNVGPFLSSCTVLIPTYCTSLNWSPTQSLPFRSHVCSIHTNHSNFRIGQKEIKIITSPLTICSATFLGLSLTGLILWSLLHNVRQPYLKCGAENKGPWT